ncbi:3'-5' exoribonuclease YhaM family protein [Bacillota bacterium]
MKEKYIGLLNTDEEIQEFFLVKNIAVKLGSNKKQYLDLLLGDNTGEVTAKKWDVADTELPALAEIQTGDVVKVKAQVTEWNGLKQLRIAKIRKSVAQDDVDMGDFIRTAPENPEDMLAFLQDTVNAMEEEDLQSLCQRVLNDNRDRLLYYPAAVKNHHAERGGLLYHMKRMISMGLRYCEVYTLLNRDLLITGVIIHDIEKLNEIVSDENGIASGYSFEGQLLGHLIQGVKTIDRLAEEMGISKERAVMLEHMILSHHYEPEYGSPKKPLFPEAEILHYLDIVDARMYDMEEALFATKPGEFSEKVWTLDNRKLYKPI